MEAFTSGGTSLGTSTINWTSPQPFQEFTISRMPRIALNSPSDCPLATCTALLHDTPTLDWQPVKDAGHYLVYLATEPNFTHITRTWSTRLHDTHPCRVTAGLAGWPATYWFVRPARLGPLRVIRPMVFGKAHAFRKQSFPIMTVSPTAGAVVPDEVTFTWQDYLVTNKAMAGTEKVDQEARNYRVQVSTTAEFTNIIDTSPFVDQTRYTAQTRTYPDGPLFWRVQAYRQQQQPAHLQPRRSLLQGVTGPDAVGAGRHGEGERGARVALGSQALRQHLRGRGLQEPRQCAVRHQPRPVPHHAVDGCDPLTPLAGGCLRVARAAPGRQRAARTVDGRHQHRPAPVHRGGRAAHPLEPRQRQHGAQERRAAALDRGPGGQSLRGGGEPELDLSPLLQSGRTDMTYWAPGLVSPSWPLGTVYWRVRTLDAKGGVLATSPRWWAKVAS